MKRHEPTGKRIRLAIILSTIAVGSIWAYVSFGVANQPGLTVSAAVLRGNLTISGRADVPDGTVLTATANHSDLVSAAQIPELSRQVDVTVRNRAYSVVVDVHDWPVGSIEVFAELEVTPSQPTALAALFGPNGERLRGPDVIDDSAVRLVRVKTTVGVSGPSAGS